MGRVLVQQPGTNTAKASTETLPKNVIIVDEDLKELRLHDGVTPGGKIIGGDGTAPQFANIQGSPTDNAALATELGKYVGLTGNQTISGTKTFNSTIESNVGAGGIALRFRTAAASTAANMDLVQAYDSTTGQRVASIRAGNGTNQRLLTLGVNNFNGSAPTGITVWCDSNNNVWATAPNSDANGSIVTTSNKSKNGNHGYFQFGNGLIVQWGIIASTGDSRSVTFPKAFSANNRYSATVTPTGSNTGGLYMVSVNNNTSTGFTVLSQGNVNNVWLFWIAIGY